MTPEELAWPAEAQQPHRPEAGRRGAPAARERLRRPALRWTWAAVVALALGWSLAGSGANIAALAGGREGALHLLRGFVRPDLSIGFLRDVAAATVETVRISLAGLVLGIIGGGPLAAAIAGNLHAPTWLRSTARTLAAWLRGVPELLWALIFVAAVGPGPAAGTLAIGVHAAGLLAKLCAEQLEAVDPAPVEAVRVTGAGRTATAALAVLPQARSGIVSLLLYQWECNLRCSAVLGFVGAGGIGQALAISLKLFEYGQLSTLVLAVLALILAVDRLSRLVRGRLGAMT